MLSVICILEEGAFHLEVQRIRRVSAWPTCFWGLVTVSLLVERGELARPVCWFFVVVKWVSPPFSPRVLGFCCVACCAACFPWAPTWKKQFFSIPLGGARLPGIVVRRSITAAPLPKVLLTFSPGSRSSFGPASVWPPGG